MGDKSPKSTKKAGQPEESQKRQDQAQEEGGRGRQTPDRHEEVEPLSLRTSQSSSQRAQPVSKRVFSSFTETECGPLLLPGGSDYAPP